MKLTGKIYTWNLGGKRQFSSLVLPFGQAEAIFTSRRYNALTRNGEQRENVKSHVKLLRKEMETGSYTPASITANLTKKHRDLLEIDEAGEFKLELDPNEQIPLTNGDHRFAALRQIRAEAGDNADIAEVINGLPFEVTLHIDGDAQRDFINLQMGKAVDKAHMFSLTAQKSGEPTLKKAMSVAKILSRDAASPFHNLIRFDSRGMFPIPISTLCAKGTSDAASSLLGLCKVCEEETDEKIAGYVTAAFQAIKEAASELLEEGKPLEEGKKGAATMWIGLATCIGYAGEVSADAVVAAAQATLGDDLNGNFSATVKRTLLGRFAAKLLEEFDVPKNQGVPVELVEKLSAGAFGLTSSSV